MSPLTFKALFVYPKFVTVQEDPEKRFSWIPHPSAENLNSCAVSFNTFPDTSQTLSPSESDIAQQSPHQLLNDPLTSGVVKAVVTLFMSTWNVTDAESAEVWALTLIPKHRVKKLQTNNFVNFFIITCFIN